MVWPKGKPNLHNRRTEEEIWALVDRSGGPDACWPWLASCNPGGYGKASWNGKRVLAHRLIAFLVGMISDACATMTHDFIHIRHSCDNPPCCNPAHFLTGSQGDNMKDMWDRGRRVCL